ncbi:MAG: hypothetical protein EPO24_15860 [Bacteroidetes bacterium]|nr:MAG: hypothetical protein EPO24_15860 [Bacteroidota bacterium]
MMRRLLGFLLFHANHNPEYKEEFYAIKRTILKRWGTFIDYELQHFTGVRCNRCISGIDEYSVAWGDDDELNYDASCYACGGTGWYKEERWVLLKKSKLGRYVFHTPISSAYGDIEHPITIKVIEGYISHTGIPSQKNRECALLLFLLYDYESFKNYFECVMLDNCFTPLGMLQRLKFKFECLNS